MLSQVVCLYLLMLIKCHGYQSSWNPDYNRHKIPQDVMVDVVNDLALKLLAIHNEGNDNNIAISPYGALSVLVALGEGLRGTAIVEIQRVANIPADISVVRIGLRDIHRHLKSYFIPEEGFLSGLTLSHDNVTLNQEYEDILKFYGYDINSFNNALYPDLYTTPRSSSTTDLSTDITTNADSTSEIKENTDITTDITSTTNNVPSTTETDRTTRSDSVTAPMETSTFTTTTEQSATKLTTELTMLPESTTATPSSNTIQSITTSTTNLETESTSNDITTAEITTTTVKLSTTTEAAETKAESTTKMLESTTIISTTETTTYKIETSSFTDNDMRVETSTNKAEGNRREETLDDSTTEELDTSDDLVELIDDLDDSTSDKSTELTTTTVGTPTTVITTTTENSAEISSTTKFNDDIDSTTFVTEDYGSDETTKNSNENDNNEALRRSTRSVVDYMIARYYDDHFITPRPPPYNSENELYFLVNGKYRESNINYMTYDTVLPFYYISHLNTLALRFPLDSTKYYLLLLLPENPEDIHKLICDLRLNTSLKYIINNLRYTHVKAIIPSFMLKGYVILTSTFQKMGIRKVFEPRQADFSPMTFDRNIYVTNIEQAITVTIRNYVDPVTMNSNRYLHQNDPVHFKADHPFLYFVIDSEIDVTLMAGKIVNPLNSRIR